MHEFSFMCNVVCVRAICEGPASWRKKLLNIYKLIQRIARICLYEKVCLKIRGQFPHSKAKRGEFALKIFLQNGKRIRRKKYATMLVVVIRNVSINEHLSFWKIVRSLIKFSSWKKFILRIALKISVLRMI